MVFSTENNYYTNFISLVMLLVAPISGLTVKISRFSYIHQHLFKKYCFQIEHCYNTPHDIHCTYPIFPHLFIFLVFTAKVYYSWIIFMALFSVQFSALHYFIYSVYTYFNYNRMFSSTFQIFLQIFNKKYYNLTFLHNISIATDDDVIQFGYDVNIYPVYLFRAIIILGNSLN